jgi:hypothetical protein
MGTGFGVGAAGAIVGTISGIATLSNAATIRPLCLNEVCPPTERGALSSATTLANISDVSFVVGAVGVAAGVIGVVLRPHELATKTGATLAPMVGPGGAGLRGSF